MMMNILEGHSVKKTVTSSSAVYRSCKEGGSDHD